MGLLWFPSLSWRFILFSYIYETCEIKYVFVMLKNMYFYYASDSFNLSIFHSSTVIALLQNANSVPKFPYFCFICHLVVGILEECGEDQIENASRFVHFLSSRLFNVRTWQNKGSSPLSSLLFFLHSSLSASE
jgi:hypothetical protein